MTPVPSIPEGNEALFGRAVIQLDELVDCSAPPIEPPSGMWSGSRDVPTVDVPTVFMLPYLLRILYEEPISPCGNIDLIHLPVEFELASYCQDSIPLT